VFVFFFGGDEEKNVVPFSSELRRVIQIFRRSFSIPYISLPSRELTYPTLGKGKSSSKVNFDGIC